ncbi:MAG: hypothetical protein ABSH27_09315, partial [Solirubrobacteraceae bacterium]
MSAAANAGAAGVVAPSLAERLGATAEDGPAGELRLRVGAGEFNAAARDLRDARARFVTIFEADTPEPALVGVFALGGELVVLRAPGGSADGTIGRWWPAARWAEQELVERGGGDGPPGGFARCLTKPDADLLDRRV